MSYITREDGEHFVIPSYREVITAKSKGALKDHILSLSQNYGDHITLQQKGAAQYEVAFSPDTGYLLGESLWHHFKRPVDMIYCEVIPNTTEAILVIVKGGSVYLDGSFPTESLSEELIIFLTQQNDFEIYIYGDVPISQTPEEGRFSFEESSVKSFTILDQPVFPTLPLLKMYQLQLVDPVLKAHGIGGFPVKKLIVATVVVGVLWMSWSYLTRPREAVQQFILPTFQTDPYAPYLVALTSPAPDREITQFLVKFNLLSTMPGWQADKIEYSDGGLVASVTSGGSTIQTLFNWAVRRGSIVNIKQNGIFVTMNFTTPARPRPTKIYNLQKVVARFVDKIDEVHPGNNLQLSEFSKKGVYSDVTITVTLTDVSPTILAFIAEQTKNLPLVMKGMKFSINEGNLTGKILIQALGS